MGDRLPNLQLVERSLLQVDLDVAAKMRRCEDDLELRVALQCRDLGERRRILVVEELQAPAVELGAGDVHVGELPKHKAIELWRPAKVILVRLEFDETALFPARELERPRADWRIDQRPESKPSCPSQRCFG